MKRYFLKDLPKRFIDYMISKGYGSWEDYNTIEFWMYQFQYKIEKYPTWNEQEIRIEMFPYIFGNDK